MLLATWESIAIWSGPRGHVPAVSLSGLKRWSEPGSTLNARLGAPPFEITLPSRPTNCVLSSLTDPAAALTSLSPLIFVRSDSGKLGAWTPFPLSFVKAVLPLTMASAFLYDSVKIDVNAPLIVSVRMNVPLINATPSTIARPVSPARSFRPARPLSVTPSIRLRARP